MRDTSTPAQTQADDDHIITTPEQLEAVYGTPKPSSLRKELTYISEHYRVLIEHSPFVTIASVGPEGLDCSPRGDHAGFVTIENERTVLLPDRRGNNRIDTLTNIVRDPRVALLFLIPGVGETLRINGRAEISVEPALLERFIVNGKAPRSVIRVHAERVYFQCQKALARSRLWDPDARVDRKTLPSAGDILQPLMDPEFDGSAYDQEYPARMLKEMW